MLRVGLFSIGLHSYWTQFAGLLPRLNEYVDRVARQLTRDDIEVINLGHRKAVITAPLRRKLGLEP